MATTNNIGVENSTTNDNNKKASFKDTTDDVELSFNDNDSTSSKGQMER